MPAPGQRWISTAEPHLGLGQVVAAPAGQVQLHFPAAEQTRLYALESAPLVRVRFKPGDELRRRDGSSFIVTEVREAADLLTYLSAQGEVPEAELSDTLAFTSPTDRLLAGLCDDPRDFDLRAEALAWHSRLSRSPAVGIRGARIDLIPHQFAIVAEACRRPHPRLLLADEVGLGKTIEACLILQHLHLSGRADRVMIVVPESLVHQWFIELLRRFQLRFTIYDESRCQTVQGAAPFDDAQLILAPLSLFTQQPGRVDQALAAGIDLLVVDEAHHLEWEPGRPSPAYAAVESLAQQTSSLLLLTATPRQRGATGHFARLRLLDPSRHGDLAAFKAEVAGYGRLATLIGELDAGSIPPDLGPFRQPESEAMLDRLRRGDETARSELIGVLLDRVGTGRVLFRNTRRRLRGFPTRQPHLCPLPPDTDPCAWLAELLRRLPSQDKVLLITDHPAAAVQTRDKLLESIQVDTALFHEDLSLLERDRQAAWFADPDGARLLISSEIGSEGRNFQFARHLVLFELPHDPERLEQRIGRLDRIGQTGTIHIHVHYRLGGSAARLARWFDEGLDAFARPLRGAATLAEELLPELWETPDFEAFLEKSRCRAAAIAAELDSGHDYLLERRAPPPALAAATMAEIQAHNEDRPFESFVLRLFDSLGLDIADHSPRTYAIHRGQRLAEVFADLPEDGVTATFDRATALAREDIDFLSADHPHVRSGLDGLLHSEFGIASFACWDCGRGKGLLLEAQFVLETLAPGRLHLDRFLPPLALRVVIDHHGASREIKIPPHQLRPGDARRLVGQPTFRQDILPTMLAAARDQAQTLAQTERHAAQQEADRELSAELDRLRALTRHTPQGTPAEITTLETQRRESLAAIAAARLRLDSLRLIWQT